MNKKIIKRALRVTAFTSAAGLSFMGAGNVMGFPAMQSAMFGALGSLTGLIIGLLLNYAVDGVLSDQDFDNNMKQSVETLQKSNKKK